MILDVKGEEKMKQFGAKLGALLNGGEVIELIGDVGTGKTTLVKGIAVGFGINENVSSPSFTISRVYNGRDSLKLAHYDFYRLHDAGLMKEELSETMADKNTATVVEWGDIVSGILPADRLSIAISSKAQDLRQIEVTSGGQLSQLILEKI